MSRPVGHQIKIRVTCQRSSQVTRLTHLCQSPAAGQHDTISPPPPPPPHHHSVRLKILPPAPRLPSSKLLHLRLALLRLHQLRVLRVEQPGQDMQSESEVSGHLITFSPTFSVTVCRPPLSAVEMSGVMSGAGDLSLPGVLILAEVEVLYLKGGVKESCAGLCQGTCLSWSWRQASHSCVLDHRQDTRGVTSLEVSQVKTEKQVKPRKKLSKPTRRTTKRVSNTTSNTTTTITPPPPPSTTTTTTTASPNKKASGKKKFQQRKPSPKKKPLLTEESPVVTLNKDSDSEDDKDN